MCVSVVADKQPGQAQRPGRSRGAGRGALSSPAPPLSRRIHRLSQSRQPGRTPRLWGAAGAGLPCWDALQGPRAGADTRNPVPHARGGDKTWAPPRLRGAPPGAGLCPPPASLACSSLPEGRLEGHLALAAACNAACGCRPEHFRPVCGSDGLTYYSPCHAGCPAAAAAPGPGGQKVRAAAARVPSARPGPGGGPLALPPVTGAVVPVLRCTETVAVSLRIFPLVLAMLLQGNALQLVRESPSFWLSYSL